MRKTEKPAVEERPAPVASTVAPQPAVEPRVEERTPPAVTRPPMQAAARRSAGNPTQQISRGALVATVADDAPGPAPAGRSRAAEPDQTHRTGADRAGANHHDRNRHRANRPTERARDCAIEPADRAGMRRDMSRATAAVCVLALSIAANAAAQQGSRRARRRRREAAAGCAGTEAGGRPRSLPARSSTSSST